MPWQQFTFLATQKTVETHEETLLELGAISITLLDAEDHPIYEPLPNETPLWESLLLVALFEDNNTPDIHDWSQYGLQLIQQETIEDQAWERAWMDQFRPMQFGQRLWVVPSNQEPPDADGIIVHLDPGLAFGTGTHETTALCLQWLDAHPPIDQDVIDFGCGSGILAIAAKKLGAKRVIAIDIDPQAIQATNDNAKANGINDIDALLPEAQPNFHADLILANILAEPLKQFANDFIGHLKPGGTIILSGILKEQMQEVADCYQQRLDLIDQSIQGDWGRLVFQANT